MFARAFAVLMFFAFALVPARAEGVPQADSDAFARIISEQIAAFNADDGAKAYSYAAPMIQNIFPNPEQFMRMVQSGYPQVYRQKSFSFEEAGLDPARRPIQKVRIIDEAGGSWIALYSFEKQPDGTWRIAGCAILKAPGESV